MPCPHHGMGSQQGSAAMPMAHHAMPMGSGSAAQHQDGQEPAPRGPFGHVPCNCAGGCPGSTAATAPPAPPLFLAAAPAAPVRLETRTPVRSAARQIPYLLPWSQAPPSLA